MLKEIFNNNNNPELTVFFAEPRALLPISRWQPTEYMFLVGDLFSWFGFCPSSIPAFGLSSNSNDHDFSSPS